MIADHLSRPNQPITTEWSLHSEIVNWIFRTWGTPNSGHVCHNPQHASSPVYVSTSRASSTGDRCSVTRLTGKLDEQFSTVPLLIKVIQKIWTTQECKVILIAPWWPLQSWFPHLLCLCLDCPLIIPYHWDLLSQQGYVSDGKAYHLHAWRLSCSTTKQQVFCIISLILKACHLKLSKDTGPA